MNWKGVTVGFGLSGSHCTLQEILVQIERFIKAGADVIPIVSDSILHTDTRFGSSVSWLKKLRELTGHEVVCSIVDAEPLGPEQCLEVLVLAPCTGNTTSKLAQAITDSPILMAAKAQLRNQNPLVLAISTNDGLGLNLRNIARLLMAKNVYFVPFGQDNPFLKANSLVANMDLISKTCEAALVGKQLQPLLIQRFTT